MLVSTWSPSSYRKIVNFWTPRSTTPTICTVGHLIQEEAPARMRSPSRYLGMDKFMVPPSKAMVNYRLRWIISPWLYFEEKFDSSIPIESHSVQRLNWTLLFLSIVSRMVVNTRLVWRKMSARAWRRASVPRKGLARRDLAKVVIVLKWWSILVSLSMSDNHT